MRGGPNIYPGSVGKCALDRDEEKSSGLFHSLQGRRICFSPLRYQIIHRMIVFSPLRYQIIHRMIFHLSREKRNTKGKHNRKPRPFFFLASIVFVILISRISGCPRRRPGVRHPLRWSIVAPYGCGCRGNTG